MGSWIALSKVMILALDRIDRGIGPNVGKATLKALCRRGLIRPGADGGWTTTFDGRDVAEQIRSIPRPS